MHQRFLLLLASAAALGAAASWAAPPPGSSGARPMPAGHGHAAPYRPYRAYVGVPVYGGGWYGYPRYYGYGLGYGLGYGVGYGTGFGYGTGWSLSVGWPWPWYSYWPSYWGAPLVPAYPYGAVVGTSPVPLVDEDLVYVQQPPAATSAASPPQPGGGHWYYCTDPAGYFPDVQECSRPWVAVKPPPAATGR